MVVGLLAAGTAAPAIAAPPHDAPGRAAAATAVFQPRFRFNFDRGESLKPGTRVVDVTGHRHYGIVRKSGPGHLSVENGLYGKAAGYHPRRACRCGKVIIQIEHNAHLNPHQHPFTFGAAVKARPSQAKPGRDPNIVQKGLNGRGTQWKLQLIGAHPACVFIGSKATVDLQAPAAIDDGTWHKLACTRIGKVFTLRVDGVVQATGTAQRLGPIANSSSVTVGGRAVGKAANNDQFHGNLDNVYLKVGKLR